MTPTARQVVSFLNRQSASGWPTDKTRSFRLRPSHFLGGDSMKIRTIIQFGFSGLAALSVCLSSAAQDKPAAQNKPDAQNKTVVVPTLREEAAKNGYARKAPIIDYFGCCKDLDDLLQKSELIVRGRAVYENPRLSDDEMSVWTDYTIEVLEV